MAPAEITLQASVLMDGTASENGVFTFVLWDAQHNILQRVTNVGADVTFAPLVYEAPGQYVYYITEEGGGDLSVAYDTGVYQVRVDVTLLDCALTAQVTSLARVTGDPVGEPTVLEAFDPDEFPLFCNNTRRIDLTQIP